MCRIALFVIVIIVKSIAAAIIRIKRKATANPIYFTPYSSRLNIIALAISCMVMGVKAVKNMIPSPQSPEK